MKKIKKTASRNVTLIDVARRAGVSAITVSRAINQPEKVSETLRLQVEKAISELGYIPNQFASSLASARSNVIGVVIPSLSNIVFNDVLRGIYDIAGRAGYKVLLVDTHYSADEEEKLVRTLLSLSPEAMIITGGDQLPGCRAMLEKASIPIVQLMELLDNPLDMNVGFSHYQAGFDIVKNLLTQGHRRVAFMGARMDARVQQRMAGYRAAMEEAGEEWESLVITTEEPSSIEMGGTLFRTLLGKPGQPDALFCCNDDLALGALFESQRMGIAIPGQLSLCGFNDFEASRFVNPSLTSVHVPRYEMGVKATEMILRRLDGKSVEKDVCNIGYDIKWRHSTRNNRQQ